MRYHVDLSIELKHPVDDPIATYFELGYEALQNIIANASPKSMVSRHTNDLVMPVDLSVRRIAAELNFAEHAGETNVKIGFLAWAMGGWGQSAPFHAIETNIDDAKTARIYLQPGDRVVIHVDRLGVVENIITR